MENATAQHTLRYMLRTPLNDRKSAPCDPARAWKRQRREGGPWAKNGGGCASRHSVLGETGLSRPGTGGSNASWACGAQAASAPSTSQPTFLSEDLPPR